MSETRHEEERIRRAQQGDRQAFALLLEENLPVVRRFLQRLGVPHDDLDDLAQEVFVTLIKRLDGFRGASRFSTWCLGITVNVVRRWRRGRPAAWTLEGGSDTLPDGGRDRAPGPVDRLLCREDGERLLAALDRLSHSLREAFVLRHVEELAVDDCAVLLNVPAGTVRRRAHDARERLRTLLGQEESRR